MQLNYDARNPFDICSVTFTPIYRGNKVGGGAGRGIKGEQAAQIARNGDRGSDFGSMSRVG